MLRIAVVDDEKLFLKNFIEKLKPFIDISSSQIDLFSSPILFLESEVSYDFIFLDIDMPKINGISIAKKRARLNEKTIFVTNRESLVFQAYNETSSIGFVRKNHLDEDLRDVFNALHNLEKNQKHITIKKGSEIINVNCREVLYFEKQINNIIIHTMTENIVYRNTMKELEKDLMPFGFVKTHEGYLVNVERIYYIGKSDIILTNRERIPVSRKNVKNVKETFLRKCGDNYV